MFDVEGDRLRESPLEGVETTPGTVPDRLGAIRNAIETGAMQRVVDEAHVATLTDDPRLRERIAGLHGLALARLGRTEEALTILAEAHAAAASEVSDAAILSAWAETAHWAGLPRTAVERANQAIALGGEPEDLVRALLTRAWAELELGRSPTPVPMTVPYRAWPAVLPELRGIEALARREWHRAAAAFDVAEHRWFGRSAPRALVCRWAATESRRRAGATNVTERLRALLVAAAGMSFEPLAARIRRSLRLAGERPRIPRTAHAAGSVLTSREAQVLQLVARGRTNDEIARYLAVGRPTVARLLSNAMVKLGATSRAHAIALAAGPEPDRPGHGATGARAEDTPASEGREILTRIASGWTLGAVARELGLSRRTADRRLASVRAELGAERTTEAIAHAQRLGWLS